MCLLSTDYISDARNFQRCGEYELAIMSLNRAREVDKQKKNGVEIEKLLSFNYRKLKQFDLPIVISITQGFTSILKAKS